MSTPDYVLIQDYTVNPYVPDSTLVPAGTFLRPLDLYYVPKHIRDASRGFNKDKEVYCYCSYGILPFPKGLLRRV